MCSVMRRRACGNVVLLVFQISREEFRKRVHKEGNGSHAVSADFTPSRVVLAFSGGGAVSDSIFTFSKIALARCAQRLGELAIDLEIARINESDEIVEP